MLSDRCLSVLSCLSVMLVCCGQTAGWIKMKLGTELGLDQGKIMLGGDPAPPFTLKGAQSPGLLDHAYCGQTDGSIKMPLDMEVDLGPGDVVLEGDPVPLAKKRHNLHFWPMSVVDKRLDGSG